MSRSDRGASSLTPSPRTAARPPPRRAPRPPARPHFSSKTPTFIVACDSSGRNRLRRQVLAPLKPERNNSPLTPTLRQAVQSPSEGEHGLHGRGGCAVVGRHGPNASPLRAHRVVVAGRTIVVGLAVVCRRGPREAASDPLLQNLRLLF